MNKLVIMLKGGSGSGDFGHTGRAGKRGGSGGGGGKGKPRKGRRSRESLDKEIEAQKKPKLSTLSQKEYIDNLSDGEKTALHSYTLSSYKTLNKSLRSGEKVGSGDEDDIEVFNGLESALSSAPVIKQRTLHRALFMKPSEMGMEEGQVYQDLGYMSTTKSAAYMFQLGAPTRLSIKAPKGTQGLEVHRISAKKKEQEILIPRNTKLKINSIKENDFGSFDVKAEIVNG